MLTAPFVDFSYWGVLIVVFVAMLFSIVFNKAQTNIVFATAYGMIGAALLLSSHVGYYSDQNFTFNMMVIAILGFAMRRPKKDVPYFRSERAV